MPVRFVVRLAAAAVDVAAGFGLALLLASLAGTWFAERAAVMLEIGRPGSTWVGVVPMLLGDVSRLSYTVPFALTLVLACEPLFGVGPGKALFGLRVTGRDGCPAGLRRVLARTALKGSGAWGLTLAIALACRPLAQASLAAALVALAGLIVAPWLGGRALHDLAAGTRVAAGPARA